MINYKNCFLGIELPDKFQDGFKKLLTDLGKIDPYLKLIEFEKLKPHITIQYLDTQSNDSLSEINQLVKQNINSVSSIFVTINGMDYFKPGNPLVLFLKVQYPLELLTLQQNIHSKLSAYLGSVEDQEFHPHITVARILNGKSQQSFENNQNVIKDLFEQISWSFQVNELTLFGIDSEKDEEIYQKIFTIPLPYN